ncbi:MAG TPA: FAD-dependent oxidoreductase [Gemmatimonadales bacterium]|nr:FAD-dependent oxidoreductase [Gemmatimonadales bacterium]
MTLTRGSSLPVVVVGAGLAGLACARRLAAAGRPLVVLEASDDVGGRVRTDEHAGFHLDRGFQVLLTAYPEARALLDYGRLHLRPFYPGALVRHAGRFHRIADPFRRPLDAAAALLSPIGTVADKARVLGLRHRARAGTLHELFRRPETSSMAALTALDFGNEIVERFFQPFLGGIFLGRELSTSSRMLDFVIRMMADGDIALPAAGMGAIARQLAAGLPDGAIRVGSEVAAVTPGGVTLRDGRAVEAAAVVVATEGPTAATLLGREPPRAWRSVTTLYFAAPRPPVRGSYLVLDGDGAGPVNNLCVPSEVAESYAPPGRALICASVLGLPESSDAELLAAVLEQLGRWFGRETGEWTHLRTYRIRYALPDQSPPTAPPATLPPMVAPGLYLAGDHQDTASINGALASGRRAAEAILTAVP